jgi:flagellar basal-body rod protein FlgB
MEIQINIKWACMFEQSSFFKNIYILEKSLNVEILRRKVIADNMANVDVPHFKRSEVNFEAELRRVLDTENQEKNLGVLSHEKHISFESKKNYRQVEPIIHLDYNTGYRNDGNNVDPDKELMLASKNQMRYNLFLQQIDQQFRILNGVMKAPF